MDTNEQTQHENMSVEEKAAPNIYPALRHLFLIICILLTLAIIVFLIYQNGKSIYENGI
jgi:ABC-type phosphate transport system permease subunit